MLEKNPKKRISAENALLHEWFIKMKTKDLLFSQAKDNVVVTLTRLSNFHKGFKLQQAVIAFIVHNIPQNDEISLLFKKFKIIDENGDGRINKQELINGLKIYLNFENPEEKASELCLGSMLENAIVVLKRNTISNVCSKILIY